VTIRSDAWGRVADIKLNFSLIYPRHLSDESRSRTGGLAVGSHPYLPPQEEHVKCFAGLRELFLALVLKGNATLLITIVIVFSKKGRFWRDPIQRFTCPLLFFVCTQPILDHFGYSFVQLFRRLHTGLRRP
jgi:hypothetical protein